MNKARHFFIVVFLFITSYSLAQIPPSAHDTVRTIEIINGKSLREKSVDSVNKIETIAGNVLIKEGLTKFNCDSAIIDRRLNTIEAFGNIHINDADSLHTYGQYLKYYGDKRFAHLKKNVKLTDRRGTLYTDDLDYDLAAGIGNYYNGGKVINGTTVLTSKDGVYYADTKDVYFRHDVDLTDPKYKIKADSLLYNTVSQVVTFIGPTHIKSKEANIYTTQGTYDLSKGNAYFGTRSLITDSSRRIYQANNIALDEKAGLAELEGNAVIKDSVNGVIVTSNHIYLNNRNNSFLGTNKPVMIIQQDKDSIYIAADTLFSGFATRVDGRAGHEQADSAAADSGNISRPLKDSLRSHKIRMAVTAKELAADSLANNLPASDSAYAPGHAPAATSMRNQDSLPPEIHEPAVVKGAPADSLKLPDNKNVKDAGRNKRAISGRRRDPLQPNPVKPVPPENPVAPRDTAGRVSIQHTGADTILPRTEVVAAPDSAITMKLQVHDSSRVDTVKGTTTINAKATDSIRYFLAFHHVRIYNDSLQSVCDSMFFSAKDSVFRLFYDPVIWSGESQVTGDTIYLYTKNKKPERLYVVGNGMIINKNDKNLYNQISGKTINAYFKNGVIDYARVRGQKAESVYYVQDKDSAYVGMNRADADVIDQYFKEGKLDKVILINDVHGTMYPMSQIPEDQKLLKNFNWQDKRRPKNKLELFE